ncbi:hypothetical protein E5Z02_20820 [Streptomyces rhizosphaericola]|uniref:Uncharacterized protein n=1 Tax=Streptomyces rhizosphaericola TaxID=2564098 RepID=A0ABY2PBT3_9ACTN|nr:hypothetical protein E5Z02_20820 [Streptomyces rhizosphaericola]
MCLLDNGTESATKRFTGSFAFSAAWCRPGLLGRGGPDARSRWAGSTAPRGPEARFRWREGHPYAFGRTGALFELTCPKSLIRREDQR